MNETLEQRVSELERNWRQIVANDDMRMSLESLATLVMERSRKLGHNHDCQRRLEHPAHLILDTSDPLFKALWTECHPDHHNFPPRPEATCAEAGCIGYVLRSREAVALRLPDAIFETGYGVEMSRGPKGDHDWHCMVAWEKATGSNWLDALCAAEEACLRAQREINLA